jgi:predicted AAA+ superfamily ATPase
MKERFFMNDSRPILELLLGEFYEKIASLKPIVKRDAQIPKAHDKIKVVIGMRRVGKTYFVFQQILELLKNGVDKRSILYINFEDDRLLPLSQKKFASLIDAFYELYPENHERRCYLFLDEIQNVDDWPVVVRRFHDSKKVEIFLTGSSAKLLSREIATNLRGRSLATELWPYSFDEFREAKNCNFDRSLYDKKTQDLLKRLFCLYLCEGGFPEVTSYDTDTRKQTLQEYLDVALYRDIIERHNIRHSSLIKYMILTMLNTAARPFTINKFYNDIKSQGYTVGKDILYEYAEHIEDAYLAFSIPLFANSYRRVQTNPKKLYAIDSGMIVAATFQNDMSKFFENCIYLDLRRLGCTIHYYLTEEHYEVDFLVQTLRGEKKLFQVVWDMADEKTVEREQRALNAAMNELKIEGEIITLDSYLRYGLKPF